MADSAECLKPTQKIPEHYTCCGEFGHDFTVYGRSASKYRFDRSDVW